MTRLIVTRPRPQCAAWLARLAALGVDAVALPLIEILPARDPGPHVAVVRADRTVARVLTLVLGRDREVGQRDVRVGRAHRSLQ